MTQLTDIDKKKRQFLHHLTVLLGGASAAQFLDGSVLSSAFAYSIKANSADKDGALLKQHHMKLLKCMVDLVMPKTETLSASELDVHGFIDHQLKTVHSMQDQQAVISLLQKVMNFSQSNFNGPFIAQSFEHQLKVMQCVEAQSHGFDKQDRKTLKLLKNLIVFGYFTTEYGATQALKYQAIPGGFKGSIEYTSVGNCWGSLGFY
ncbi:gluconate 2-dehydrogenase subunit 3 family protein [Pseudoalteromonas sp. JBTF-M23]|uniref:Gluconate 2-dehydrogenase subunit 3 family protein n=1 Tax=Pseudoalteromonas caenipelagi TaxID=2726988 RepID=A0A849VKK4_9GAMM|nr:gluconate 2-dehydrogenase subunit 3 family protein [Pseudoalteromonas caenipelagi]NOU52231.1 gluconate 2-dehydrogenase subunit 3 family protein [Pseudoalteromonas caenipelagi]